MSENNQDQIETGIRAIFSHPAVYKTFQRVVGRDRAFRKYVNEVIKPAKNSRILDIGCGEGSMLDFLPQGVTYVGYDMSTPYINYARKKYGHRGTFINERVSAMTMETNEPFDIVLTYGLLHHLNDEEGKDLFRIGATCLKTGGQMFTCDNAYMEGQSPIARYISSKDRGQHVRYPEQYKALAMESFATVEVIIRHDLIFLPQTACILKCIKN